MNKDTYDMNLPFQTNTLAFHSQSVMRNELLGKQNFWELQHFKPCVVPNLNENPRLPVE